MFNSDEEREFVENTSVALLEEKWDSVFRLGWRFVKEMASLIICIKIWSSII